MRWAGGRWGSRGAGVGMGTGRNPRASPEGSLGTAVMSRAWWLALGAHTLRAPPHTHTQTLRAPPHTHTHTLSEHRQYSYTYGRHQEL